MRALRTALLGLILSASTHYRSLRMNHASGIMHVSLHWYHSEVVFHTTLRRSFLPTPISCFTYNYSWSMIMNLPGSMRKI